LHLFCSVVDMINCFCTDLCLILTCAFYVISCVAIQSIERKRVSVQACPLCHLSICLSSGWIVENGWLDLDGIWSRECGQLRDECIRWGGDRWIGRVSFGVNVRHPFVTNGDLLHSCAKLHELIELSFRVVSGVSSGMGVLDGVHMPQGEWEFFLGGGWCWFVSMYLLLHHWQRNVFGSCDKIW